MQITVMMNEEKNIVHNRGKILQPECKLPHIHNSSRDWERGGGCLGRMCRPSDGLGYLFENEIPS